MKKYVFIIANLFVNCFYSTSQTFTVDTLIYNGNPSNRINILIMGDGYTAAEMPQFRSDAQSLGDYLLNTPPFNEYRNFFNVFGIEVISNESGIDHPGTNGCTSTQPIISVDSYLESSFDSGVHRCIYSSQTGLIYSIANANFPQYDYINVIANTSYYGGCAGTIAFTSMSASALNVFVHEFGHSFGNLSDEYDYGSSNCVPGTNQGVNVSQQTDTSLLVWKNWLTNAPIPTPNATNCSLIGLYEGAQHCATDWYRPKCNCKMRSSEQPFCEICTEQLIYKTSSLVNYIENYSPPNLNPVICGNSPLLFSTTILNNLTNTIKTQWFVDNVLVASNISNYTFDPTGYADGAHQIKVVAYDTTAQAKKTLTTREVIWNTNIASNLPSPQLSVTTLQNSICNGGNDGNASVNTTGGTPFLVFPQSQNTIIIEDWEGANTWTLVNGTQPNKWVIGTATANGGSKSIYVSNDNTSNTYSINSSSIVHFFKDFTFPFYATNISITFDWKGYGENYYDDLKIFLVPTSTIPIAGNPLTIGQIGGAYNSMGTFTTTAITGLDANAGLTKRVVFSWKNDEYLGTQPPVAIDNIIISYDGLITDPYIYSWNTIPAQYTTTASELEPGNYIVTAIDSNGCTAFAPVTITEPPTLVLTTNSVNINCAGQSGEASVSVAGGTPFSPQTNSPYIYSWNTIPIQNTPTITGLAAGNYVVTVTDSNNCSAFAPVTIIEPPPLTLTTTTIYVTDCKGEASVDVSGGTPFQGFFVIGTGLNVLTNTNYPAPYGNYYQGAKHQFLYLGSEAQAQGLSAGTITSLAFNVASISGTTNYSDFSIKMRNSSIATINSFQSGLSTVFTPQNITITTGWNTNIFSTPFIWDGVSNIIVEICFQNASWTNNSSVYYTPTTFSSAVYYHEDATGVCSNNAITGTSTNRPNIKFVQQNGYTYLWSNGDTTATISGLNSGNYTITATDANGCSTTSLPVNISNGIASPPAILQNGSSLICSVPGMSSYEWFLNNNPIPACISDTCSCIQNGLYYVKISDANGCTASSDTVEIINCSVAAISETINMLASATIYPNPNTGTFVLSLQGMANKEISIKIMNMLGEVIFQEEGAISSQKEINLGKLSAGVYHLQLHSGNDRLYKKMMVE